MARDKVCCSKHTNGLQMPLFGMLPGTARREDEGVDGVESFCLGFEFSSMKPRAEELRAWAWTASAKDLSKESLPAPAALDGPLI